VPAYSRLHNYSPEQPDCTPKGTLGYYPHISTEPLHAIIVLTPHFTNTFTHALVFISHRHNQNPSRTNRHQGSTVIPTRNPRVVVFTGILKQLKFRRSLRHVSVHAETIIREPLLCLAKTTVMVLYPRR
jgi:tetraacyldisaccharide-1-P 4'-kinase